MEQRHKHTADYSTSMKYVTRQKRKVVQDGMRTWTVLQTKHFSDRDCHVCDWSAWFDWAPTKQDTNGLKAATLTALQWQLHVLVVKSHLCTFIDKSTGWLWQVKGERHLPSTSLQHFVGRIPVNKPKCCNMAVYPWNNATQQKSGTRWN